MQYLIEPSRSRRIALHRVTRLVKWDDCAVFLFSAAVITGLKGGSKVDLTDGVLMEFLAGSLPEKIAISLIHG